MATFFMFGRYSSDAMKRISVKRTNDTINLIKNLGGKVISMYTLLGKYDVVIIADLPGIEEAIKLSVALCKMTGISFSTSQAITVEKFDKLFAKK